MKHLALLMMLASALIACSAPGDDGSRDETGTTTAVVTDTSDTDTDEILGQLMGAALEELVAENEPGRFTELLVLSHLDPRAGSADRASGGRRPLTAAERAAVEDAIGPFGPVRWIDDPEEWRTADLQPVIEGSVILGVGEPTVDGDTALVPVSQWCGGLCGTWLTYRLTMADDTWQVTGTEGTIAIA